MLGGEKGRERLRVCRGSRSPSQSDLVGIVSVPVKKVLELYLPYLAGLAFAINFSHWVGIGTAWPLVRAIRKLPYFTVWTHPNSQSGALIRPEKDQLRIDPRHADAVVLIRPIKLIAVVCWSVTGQYPQSCSPGRRYTLSALKMGLLMLRMLFFFSSRGYSSRGSISSSDKVLTIVVAVNSV